MSDSLPVYRRGQVYAALRQGFGFDEFRLGQAEVLRSILRGRPTISVLPTGGGKSLCYQLPALLFPGTSLVISPLIALMRDQVTALRARGIAAASLNSSQNPAERAEAERAFSGGGLKLLYVSPERLDSERFLDLLAGVRVPFVAVDEAHCVLRWGHEFREAYLRVGPFLTFLSPTYRAAFTATATPELRAELGAALGMEDPEILVRGFFRDNLELATERSTSDEERRARLLELIRGREGRAPALVYAATRVACEETARFLRGAGLRVEYYHAGCEGEDRSRIQDLFLADRIDALVATNAFGMGIDKPDLRLLVHISLPASFEDYYQEMGRAGRDGQVSRVILLWRGADYRTRSFLAEQAENPAARAAALRRLHRFYEAVRGNGCLWRQVLGYFGDPAVGDLRTGCGACHRCRGGGPPLRTLEGREREDALALLGCVAELDGRYGRRKLTAILRGSRARGVPDWPRSRGHLKGRTAQVVDGLLQSLVDAGLLQVLGNEYPVIGLTRDGRETWERGGEVVVHAVPSSSRP